MLDIEQSLKAGRQALEDSTNAMIDGAGIQVEYKNVKTQNIITINAAIATIDHNKETLVNSYGVNGRVITVKATDFTSGYKPEKHDQIRTAYGELFIADDVFPVLGMNGTPLVYSIYCKGR